jgi:tetratricopeptide (TPR) repeat protein
MAKKKSAKAARKLHLTPGRKSIPLPRLEKKAAGLWNRQLFREAEKTYLKILSVRPNHLEAHFRLGFMMMQNGRFEQALFHLLRAKELSPPDARILYNLGEAYGQMSRTEEAIDSYLSCLELCRDTHAEPAPEPGVRPPTVMANLAYLYFRINRYEPAHEYTLKALEAEPGNLVANLIHAKLDRNKGQYDKAASRLAGLPLIEGNNLINASILNELGHVYDRLGRYDQALEAAGESNRIMARSPGAAGIDPRYVPYFVHLTKKYLQQEKNSSPLQARQQVDDAFHAPVFLVGFPRSGTTLTEQLLYRELDMTVSDEFPVIMNMIKSLPRLLQRKFSYPVDLDSLSHDEILLLRRAYWDEMDNKVPDASLHQDNFLDKLPLNLVNLPFIERIFPDSRVIVALRDPRDVCISNFFQMFKLNESMIHFLDFSDTVKFYNTVMSLWIQLRQQIRLPFMESRYEDLVNDKEGGISALAGFLRVDLRDAAHDTEGGGKNRYISTPSHFDATQPIYRRSLERWRNYQDILGEYFVELDPTVRELGYPPVDRL